MPQEARDIALARWHARAAAVAAGVSSWFESAMARPDFQAVVFPLLRAVIGALEAAGGFEPSLDGRGGAASAASGDRMEARALVLIQAALPRGWSLLTNAHVVALDGRHPGHHAACKWECDFVALDESGTAVALFEVCEGHLSMRWE